MKAAVLLSAGTYLHDMLNRYRLDRKQLYITSVLKCYHAGNMKKSQIETCFPWTIHQVSAADPTWILVMGRSAEQGFWGKKTGKALPSIRHWRGYPCVVTCHPAAAMRFPDQDRIFQQGLKMVGGKIELGKVHRKSV